jgi:hypothetical protein
MHHLAVKIYNPCHGSYIQNIYKIKCNFLNVYKLKFYNVNDTVCIVIKEFNISTYTFL